MPKSNCLLLDVRRTSSSTAQLNYKPEEERQLGPVPESGEEAPRYRLLTFPGRRGRGGAEGKGFLQEFRSVGDSMHTIFAECNVYSIYALCLSTSPYCSHTHTHPRSVWCFIKLGNNLLSTFQVARRPWRNVSVWLLILGVIRAT